MKNILILVSLFSSNAVNLRAKLGEEVLGDENPPPFPVINIHMEEGGSNLFVHC